MRLDVRRKTKEPKSSLVWDLKRIERKIIVIYFYTFKYII